MNGALKMQKEIGDRAGGVMGTLASGQSSLLSMTGATENQCEKLKEFCEENFTGIACEQQRQTTALFYVIHEVCRFDTLSSNAMSSPECQAVYQTCVGGKLESDECRALLRRHGV